MRILYFFAVVLTIAGIILTIQAGASMWGLWLVIGLCFYLPIVLHRIYLKKKAIKNAQADAQALEDIIVNAQVRAHQIINEKENMR